MNYIIISVGTSYGAKSSQHRPDVGGGLAEQYKVVKRGGSDCLNKFSASEKWVSAGLGCRSGMAVR
jgi:hypothetical protein